MMDMHRTYIPPEMEGIEEILSENICQTSLDSDFENISEEIWN